MHAADVILDQRYNSSTVHVVTDQRSACCFADTPLLHAKANVSKVADFPCVVLNCWLGCHLCVVGVEVAGAKCRSPDRRLCRGSCTAQPSSCPWLPILKACSLELCWWQVRRSTVQLWRLLQLNGLISCLGP